MAGTFWTSALFGILAGVAWKEAKLQSQVVDPPQSSTTAVDGTWAMRRVSTADLRLHTTRISYSGFLGDEAIDLQPPNVEMSAEAKQTLVFKDKNSRTTDQGHRVVRTVESAECEQTAKVGDRQTGPHSSTSPFQSRTMSFLEGQDGQLSVVELESSELGEPLPPEDYSLARYDLPLTEIFPIDTIRSNASWRMPKELLDDVLAPGGNLFPLSRKAVTRPAHDAVVSEFTWFYAGTVLKPAALLPSFEGYVDVKFKGIESFENHEFSIFDLTVNVKSTCDCSTYLERRILSQIPRDRPYSYAHSMTTTLVGSGVLRLSPNVDVPSSLQLDLEVQSEEILDIATELNNGVTHELGSAKLRAETAWQGNYTIEIQETPSNQDADKR